MQPIVRGSRQQVTPTGRFIGGILRRPAAAIAGTLYDRLYQRTRDRPDRPPSVHADRRRQTTAIGCDEVRHAGAVYPWPGQGAMLAAGSPVKNGPICRPAPVGLIDALVAYHNAPFAAGIPAGCG